MLCMLQTELVEGYLERELQARIPDFDMHAFIHSLQTHREEVVEEVLDLLLSFSDFLSFKQLMLHHKAV
ncbi:ADP-ribosylation factor-like protein 2-binding protein, partial [Geodia barretti]